MIRLTRLNRVSLILNSDLIEHIDITPDTVITLTNGQIVRVLEAADEVIRRVIEFRRRTLGLDLHELVARLPEDSAGDPQDCGGGR
jgi:flagellar protein FlbD